jgi:predicted transcriptional regulator
MKEFICKHYGSLDKCAEELNVGRSTVYRWVQSNPRGILLHAPEILRDKDTTSLELVSEVVHREGQLTKAEDA